MGNITDKTKKLHKYIQDEDQPYKLLFNQYAHAAYMVLDYNGNFIEGNQGCFELFGYQEKELIGAGIRRTIHPDDLNLAECYFQEALQGKTGEKTFRITSKNGQIKSITTEAVPIRSLEREPLGIFIIGKEISKERKNQAKIREQDKKFKSLIMNSSDMISIINQSGNIVYRSPSVESVLGYKPEELTDQVFSLLHPDDLERCQKIYREVSATPGQSAKLELKLKNRNGEWRDFQMTATNLFHDPNINGIVLNSRDITDLKRAHREVQFMAYYDHLTQLPNRRFLEEELQQKLQETKEAKKKLAVMFIDVDRFKIINDTLGHHTGDKVLKEIASVLTSCVDTQDVVTRWAGDEFVILISHMETEQCVKIIADRIKRCLNVPLNIDQYELFVTVSMGVSIFPEAGDTIHSLMKNADLAMYLAKEKGKNDFQIFAPNMNISTFKTFSLQNDLNNVLDKNELELYYQPKVNAKTNEVTGAEALIRWNHPEWGLVSPLEFISLAEESGHIIPIGEWVVREVCRQMKEWKKAGFPQIVVSVNFSVLQFLQKDFLQTIKKILKEYDIDGKWLGIEITESMILEKETDMVNAIDSLTDMGIQIALDDFGTGYSSLGYLMKYKFHTIKLDKTFVRNIHLKEDNAAIVRFVTNLAKQLNMKVVAEGVELEEQIDMLRHLKCDEFQGFRFSKPKKAIEFEKFLNGKPLHAIMPSEKKAKRSLPFSAKLEKAIDANMTIAELKGRKVNVGDMKVRIEEISRRGMHFSTDIRLSLEVELLLQFTFEVPDGLLTLKGNLIWHEEKDNLHYYDVEFCFSTNKEEKDLQKQIQNYSDESVSWKQLPNMQLAKSRDFI